MGVHWDRGTSNYPLTHGGKENTPGFFSKAWVFRVGPGGFLSGGCTEALVGEIMCLFPGITVRDVMENQVVGANTHVVKCQCCPAESTWQTV